MGDFLLDFRPATLRQTKASAEALRFMPHVQARTIDEREFSLVLTFTGRAELWEPFRASDGTLIAVAGRVALSENEWRLGETNAAPGGLAAKAMYELFRNRGVKALEELGGNCAIMVYDAAERLFYLVSDCSGVFPAFKFVDERWSVIGSHPDVLARACDVETEVDEVSLSEFVLNSTVTPPFTYYKRVVALENGTTTTICLGNAQEQKQKTRRYFEIKYCAEEGCSEAELAEELAFALRDSVRRRTLNRLGRTAVALSGGLDSRAILSCIENKEQVFAFCCYNEPNRELRVAEAIARASDVPFFRWKRSFEYYGDTARLGTKISGGMGTFANNHFLGIVENLNIEGAENFLTGCYCDYLFKGLPLNRHYNWLTGSERLAPFSHQFYFRHRTAPTELARLALERSRARIPSALTENGDDERLFQLEVVRSFPLCYEGDNQQRLVPQRVTGWSVPVADQHVLKVYRKLPSRIKLNRSLFSKAVRILCPASISEIPDANTGAPPGASSFEQILSLNALRVKRRFSRFRDSVASEESWPNWSYYIRHSKKLEDLWNTPNSDATELFERILGRDQVPKCKEHIPSTEQFLFVSLLTTKLWLEQRK